MKPGIRCLFRGEDLETCLGAKIPSDEVECGVEEDGRMRLKIMSVSLDGI